MKIAVAGGKGGTGKTTVAVNLAVALADIGYPVQLLDCDVEEPNGHLLLKPKILSESPVKVPVPVVDEAKCSLCGQCARLCAFGAIALLKDSVAVFPELCHSCGGCAVVCPDEAIVEEPREVGMLALGEKDGIKFGMGTLHVGEPRAMPVIEEVKQHIDSSRTVILDLPPGTSCPVMAALKDVDYVILVTEPTPFGLHDLKLIVEAATDAELPVGIVVNRVGIGDDRVQAFARERGVPILAEIPDRRSVAEAQARGQLAWNVDEEFAAAFRDLGARILEKGTPCVS